MKRVLIAAVVLGGLAATTTSCKKDYTCECTATDASSNITYTAKMKKSDAEDWCDTWDKSGVLIDGWKCELK